MPKFFTICYGETYTESGKRRMTGGARLETAETAVKIRKIIEGSPVLVITSGIGVSQECADVVCNNILHAHQFKNKVLAKPGDRNGPIIAFLRSLEKKAKRTGVFIVITSPDNHGTIETLIQSGLKTAQLIDVDDEYDESSEYYSTEDEFDLMW
ncbi:hypothetical protein KC850_01180 [Candidatus Kaiserbacteria bacterium]|nr:hypothetical protein [Candidatus Kaiserbacteria bacterium]